MYGSLARGIMIFHVSVWLDYGNNFVDFLHN